MPSIINALTASGGGVSITGDATGNLALQTAGNTAVTIDTSQNVGIGTSSPTDTAGFSRALDLNGASGAAYYARTNGSATSWTAFGNFGTDGYVNNRAAGSLIFANNATERMRVNSSGNFLVGTTADITTGGTSVARVCFDSGSGQNGMKVRTNDTSYAAYISTTTASDHYFGYMNNSAGTNVGSIFCSNTTTTYNTGSDYRLKENVARMTGALARVQQLKPCTYTWKVDGSSGQGFIAHELQEVVPECVTGEKDAVNEDGSIKPQGVDTSFLIATLTAAIQELKAELDATKAEVQALKGVA